jgi:hypothetical protein
MATIVLTNAFVLLNSVDLSDHVKSVTLNYEADMQDNTAMSMSTKSNLPGLKNWDISIDFLQDYAAAKVEATMFPLVGAAAFPFELRGSAAAVSVTNPKYTGTGLLQSFAPIAGGVGDVQMAPVKIVPGGASNTLTRATA